MIRKAAAMRSPSRFRFGLSPSFGLARTQQVAARIEEVMAATTDGTMEVAVAGSYEHLEAMVLGGIVDAAWANPLLLARLHAAGATVRLRGIRQGSTTFHSALVCRAGEPLTLDGLVGRRAAWTDPDSLAGYRLPIRFLRARGLHPERLFQSERFTFSYPAALGRVLEGSADVGPCFVHHPNPRALDTVLRLLVGDDAGRLTALAFTDPMPNDGIVFAPHLRASEADVLCRRLLTFARTEAGRVVLELLDVEALVPDDGSSIPELGWFAAEV
jgi:phosphonate transport system substrate-binding protein